jgi:hypothetical protein
MGLFFQKKRRVCEREGERETGRVKRSAYIQKNKIKKAPQAELYHPCNTAILFFSFFWAPHLFIYLYFFLFGALPHFFLFVGGEWKISRHHTSTP